MPLYIGDYLASTSHLDAARSGAYLHLLMHYWQHGPLPNDAEVAARIARLSGADAQSIAMAVLDEFFVLESDNRWHQQRSDDEIAHAAKLQSTLHARAIKGGAATARKFAARATAMPFEQGLKPSLKPSLEPSLEPSSKTAPSPSPTPSLKTRASKEKAPRSGPGARVLSKALKAPLVLKPHGLSFQKHEDEDAQRVTRAIVKATGISDGWVIRQITLQAALELKAHPGKVGKVADEMLSAYRAYCDALERDSLKKPRTKIEKFFGEGLWRDPGRWGYKAGQQPYCIPVPRAPYPPSSTHGGLMEPSLNTHGALALPREEARVPGTELQPAESRS